MKAQVVSFHCVLKNRMGEVIGTTFNHEVVNRVAEEGELLPGLAEGLRDLRKGERRRITVEAERAYGLYDPRLVVEIPRKKMPRGVSFRAGQEVMAEAYDGRSRAFRIVRETEKTVTIDGNHPLAGQDLVFEVEALEVRDATPEDVAESRASEVMRVLH